MAQSLLVFQSLWAMERRQPDGMEWSLDEKLEKIIAAGFDGVSAEWVDRRLAKQITSVLKPKGLSAEGVCFPKTIDELKPSLEIGTETGLQHLNLQPNARLRSLKESVQLLEGWARLAEQVDFPVYIETHRDRMTTDLFFTLDLLDQLPGMKILADLSHFFVGREFAVPVSEENHRMIERILDNSWAMHGRIASREQVQIEIQFPQHKHNVDLFKRWWRYGIESWRKRAKPDAKFVFTCELGPQPYAISGPDGKDLSDRWEDSLALRGIIKDVWNR
ncbi:MAG: sugar phosphate isomerase/epimerase family protein [Aestuariivirga sp.]